MLSFLQTQKAVFKRDAIAARAAFDAEQIVRAAEGAAACARVEAAHAELDAERVRHAEEFAASVEAVRALARAELDAERARHERDMAAARTEVATVRAELEAERARHEKEMAAAEEGVATDREEVRMQGLQHKLGNPSHTYRDPTRVFSVPHRILSGVVTLKPLGFIPDSEWPCHFKTQPKPHDTYTVPPVNRSHALP
jgi:hypothetical protein